MLQVCVCVYDVWCVHDACIVISSYTHSMYTLVIHTGHTHQCILLQAAHTTCIPPHTYSSPALTKEPQVKAAIVKQLHESYVPVMAVALECVAKIKGGIKGGEIKGGLGEAPLQLQLLQSTCEVCYGCEVCVCEVCCGCVSV